MHKADGEEGPVGPGEALSLVGLSPFGGMERVSGRPECLPAVALSGTGVEFAVGFGGVLRGVASIRADGDGVGAKGFGDVVDVVEEGTDVAAAAEECGYIGDAHGAPGVEYRADDVVGFASDVFVYCAGDGVADNDGLCGCFCCVEAGLPAGVGEVNDDAEAVHFGDCGMSKVAQARVVGFATAVSDGIAAVVREVHHARAELCKDADEAQFFFRVGLVASEWNAVAGEIGAAFARFVRCDDGVGCGGALEEVGHGVGVVRVSGKAFDEAQGVVAFFACVLKGAGDARGTPDFPVFSTEFGGECPAGHAHVFGEVLQFAVRRACFDGSVDGVGIDG